MKKRIAIFLCLLGAAVVGRVLSAVIVYPNRWVFITSGLQTAKDVEDIREIARVGSEHGLNGMVLSVGLDRMDLQTAAYFGRLEQVKQIAEQYSLEVIPQIFSAGYGGSIIAYNRNLAEGLPVKDALFVVRNGVAWLEPDPAPKIINGGFEDYSGNQARGYSFHDRPGEVSFIDKENFHSGAVSLGFRNFENFQYGHARVMQEVPVRPFRCYRVTVWVKTQGLKGDLKIQILSTTGRAMAPLSFSAPATSDWRKLTAGVNTSGEEKIRLDEPIRPVAGLWGPGVTKGAETRRAPAANFAGPVRS